MFFKRGFTLRFGRDVIVACLRARQAVLGIAHEFVCAVIVRVRF